MSSDTIVVAKKVWLRFYESVFGFPHDIACQIPYFESRLKRWDGVKGVGKSRDNPIVMDNVMPLQRFLRVYEVVKRGNATSDLLAKHRDDFLFLGVDLEDAAITKPCPKAHLCGRETNVRSVDMLLQNHTKTSRKFFTALGTRFTGAFVPKSWVRAQPLWRKTACFMHTREHAAQDSLNFGKLCCFYVPRSNLDLISKWSLSVILPALPEGVVWKHNVLQHLVQTCSLIIGGVEIEGPISGEANALLAFAHAMPIHADATYQKRTAEERVQRASREWRVDIPLLFSDTRFKRQVLPIMRLTMHQVLVHVRFAPVQKLIVGTQTQHDIYLEKAMLLTEGIALPFFETIPLDTASAWIRSGWQSTGWQRVQPGSQWTVDFSEWQNCCSGLVLMWDDDGSVPAALRNDPEFNPFLDCTLSIADDNVGVGEYGVVLVETASRMRTWHWQQCCSGRIPKRSQWYLLPFSDDMFGDKPNATIQFLKLKAKLTLTLNKKVFETYPNWHVNVCAPTFNVARCLSGMLDMRFSWDS